MFRWKWIILKVVLSRGQEFQGAKTGVSPIFFPSKVNSRSFKEQFQEFARLLPPEGKLLGGESGPKVLGDREVRSTSNVSWRGQ